MPCALAAAKSASHSADARIRASAAPAAASLQRATALRARTMESGAGGCRRADERRYGLLRSLVTARETIPRSAARGASDVYAREPGSKVYEVEANSRQCTGRP